MNKISDSNIFYLNRSELSNRLEAEFYRPSLYKTEKLVKLYSHKKLKDFIVKISSGATPSVTEEDKYYSDRDNGIPFLRVQNLQTNGKLNLKDVKYINHETHNNYLKRSQVSEFDLLVKITGVGRMAIASVAPEGFIGNTNQHLVVIKTKNRETSEYLAKYLNLDIVEKLASRRSTGATRPALDYPALKSLPVIENIDFSDLDDALTKQGEMQKLVHVLLNEIDVFMLDQFNINIPPSYKHLSNRVFIKRFSEISGNRFDADYFSSEYLILTTLLLNYSHKKLGKLSSQISDAPHERPDFADSGVRVIMIEHLKADGIQQDNERFITMEYHEKLKSTKLQKNDLLMARIGVTTGATSIVDDYFVNANISGNITLIRLNSTEVLAEYVLAYLNSKLGRLYTKRILSNSARDFLTVGKIKSIEIPIIPISQQKIIVEYIKTIRQKILEISTASSELLANAKQVVENQLIYR